jgi:hypothetical protein
VVGVSDFVHQGHQVVDRNEDAFVVAVQNRVFHERVADFAENVKRDFAQRAIFFVVFETYKQLVRRVNVKLLDLHNHVDDLRQTFVVNFAVANDEHFQIVVDFVFERTREFIYTKSQVPRQFVFNFVLRRRQKFHTFFDDALQIAFVDYQVQQIQGAFLQTNVFVLQKLQNQVLVLLHTG